jgi:hypothetical protein
VRQTTITQLPPSKDGQPFFVFAFNSLLPVLLPFLDLESASTLRRTCHSMFDALELDLKELALLRYLGPFGYCRVAPSVRTAMPLPQGHTRSQPDRTLVSATRDRPIPPLDWFDLEGFMIATQLKPEDYTDLAKEAVGQNLHPVTLRMVQASCRAHTKLVLRVRSQADAGFVDPAAGSTKVVYKLGRAAALRVFVPTRSSSWMTDEVRVACFLRLS